MRVKELIKALEALPPHATVSVSGYEGGVTDKFSVRLEPLVRLGDPDRTEHWHGEHEVVRATNGEDDDADYGKRVVISRG